MKIHRILFRGVHRLGPEQHPCMIFVWPGKQRVIPVWIDERAADELLATMQLGTARPRRPRAIDLCVDALEQKGAEVKLVALRSVHNGVFHADIVDMDLEQVDARPSDAVQIALSTGTAIFAFEDVLKQCAMFVTPEECLEQFGLSEQDLAPTEEELAMEGGKKLKEALLEGEYPDLLTSASGDAEADAMFAELMGSMGVDEADLDLGPFDQDVNLDDSDEIDGSGEGGPSKEADE